MKMPRWLVWSLLSLSGAAVLTCVGWWWIAWPERTAHEFISRVTNGEDEAQWIEMLGSGNSPSRIVKRLIAAFPPTDWAAVRPQPTSPIDMIVGRHAFKTDGEFGWEFVVQRGVVSLPSENDAIDLLRKAAAAKEREVLRKDQERERQHVDAMKSARAQ